MTWLLVIPAALYAMPIVLLTTYYWLELRDLRVSIDLLGEPTFGAPGVLRYPFVVARRVFPPSTRSS